MRRNYQQKLLQVIFRRIYDTKLSASILFRGKCGNYRDTDVSKNLKETVYRYIPELYIILYIITG